MRYYIKNILLLITGLALLSCNNSSSNSASEKEIISLIIDTVAISLPPPPTPKENIEGGIQKIDKSTLDSIKSIELDIGLYPQLINYNEPAKRKINYPSGFEELINKIPAKDSVKIERTDLLQMKNKKVELVLWTNQTKLGKYDVLVKISSIVWSNDHKKAVAVAIRKLGKFNGTTFLFLFKKVKNKMEIEKKYVLYKS